MHPVAQQLQTLRSELNAAFFEREDLTEASLLAILSQEHVFAVGAPGSAKSEFFSSLAGAFVNADYFEVGMSKKRSADAVLGPIDLVELRTNGHLFRKDKGFLPSVHLAFIDEIGKMGPILGHDMLAILNERKKYVVNGGLSYAPVPLSTAFTASNEMLTDDSEEAAALWDRLMFRVVVDYIKSGRNFAALLQGQNTPVSVKIDWTDVEQAIAVDVPAVNLGQDAVKAVMALKKALADKGIVVSDRRWKKSMKALKAKAFLEGRTDVYEEDLSVLRFTLWETIPQIEDITKLTSSAANPFVEKVLNAKSLLQEIAKGMDARKDQATAEKADYAKDITPKLATVRSDLDALLNEAKGRPVPQFKEVADLHRDLLARMYRECFGLDDETALHAISNKLGLGDGTTVAV